MSLNSPLFDYKKCILNDRGSRMQEIKDSENKDGAGRVAMWTKHGILRAYTLEAGYNMCTSLAKALYPEAPMPAKFDKFWSPITDPPDYDGILPNGFGNLCKLKLFETQSATYFFTQRDYELVGKEIGTSLLDLVDRNPISRIVSSPVKHMRGLMSYFALKVVGEEVPYKNDPVVKLLQASDIGEQTGTAERLLQKLLEEGKLSQEDIEALKLTVKAEPVQASVQPSTGTKKVGVGKSKTAAAKKAPGATAVKPKPKVEVTFIPRKHEPGSKPRKLSVGPENGYSMSKPSSSGLERDASFTNTGTRERIAHSHSLGRVSKNTATTKELVHIE